MIVYKEWTKWHKTTLGGYNCHYSGWFLFGIIPLYINKIIKEKEYK